MTMCLEYIAVANVDGGGHYTTQHSLTDCTDICDEKVFSHWIEALSGDLSLGAETERIIEQNVMERIDDVSEVSRASFCFGDKWQHCIVVFIKRP